MAQVGDDQAVEDRPLPAVRSAVPSGMVRPVPLHANLNEFLAQNHSAGAPSPAVTRSASHSARSRVSRSPAAFSVASRLAKWKRMV